MIPDLDIYRSANVLVKQGGDGARVESTFNDVSLRSKVEDTRFGLNHFDSDLNITETAHLARSIPHEVCTIPSPDIRWFKYEKP